MIRKRPNPFVTADLLGVLFDTEGEGGGGTTPEPKPTAPAKPAEPSTPSGDNGFPADTPISEMTGEQRENYWKHQARKHEATVKARGDYDDLKAKAAKHDALERELMSDKDKAVAEAKDSARAEAFAAVTPRLVAAEIRAAAAGRIEADRLAGLIAPLGDMAWFIKDGEVDTDKVSAFVNASAAPAAQQQKGPTAQGQGRRDSSTGPSLASGRELYLAQNKKRTA